MVDYVPKLQEPERQPAMMANSREIESANTSEAIVINSDAENPGEIMEEEVDEDDIWQQEANGQHSDDRNGKTPITPSTIPSDEAGTFSPAYWVTGNNNVPFLGHSQVRRLREQEIDPSFVLRDDSRQTSPMAENPHPVTEANTEAQDRHDVSQVDQVLDRSGSRSSQGENAREGVVEGPKAVPSVFQTETPLWLKAPPLHEPLSGSSDTSSGTKVQRQQAEERALPLSGYFTNRHYKLLRQLYRQARDQPGRFAYHGTAERAQVIGDWIWTSDGRHGTPVTEDQFSVVDRFVQQLKRASEEREDDEWTEEEVHRRLISVILGEQIRGQTED